MIEINIILTLFFFCLLSFFDFIVFNEEILLALCFLAFIFYCFNTLSESVSSGFESRALKFEQDLLGNFNDSKNLLISDFSTGIKLLFFNQKFNILFVSILHFLSVCVSFISYKFTWVLFTASLSKLSELSIFNKNFISFFNKACVVQLLYSLILKKSNNDLTFLAGSAKPKLQLIELKNLSFV